jgi:cell pole-organizing protein PopZ
MQPPEQSVEDILASIRRIIVEDEPATAAVPTPPASDAPEPDDVLELTRPLPPEPVREVAPPPPPPPAPSLSPPPPSPTPPTASRPALVSPVAADASRQALAYLSSLNLGGSDPADDTLKSLVREMLRPMLKAWLDAELPGMVERLVVQEIARLTAQRD